MAIAQSPLIVIDCPDPGTLARFYGAMLDWKIDVSTDRASACAEHGQCISFHRVADYRPPTWPTQTQPQQMHLDLLVDDLDAAEGRGVRAIPRPPARPTEHQPGPPTMPEQITEARNRPV